MSGKEKLKLFWLCAFKLGQIERKTRDGGMIVGAETTNRNIGKFWEYMSFLSPREVDIDNGKAVHVHDMKTYGGLVVGLHSLLI